MCVLYFLSWQDKSQECFDHIVLIAKGIRVKKEELGLNFRTDENTLLYNSLLQFSS